MMTENNINEKHNVEFITEIRGRGRPRVIKSEEELTMTRELTHLHKILIQMQRESYQNVRKLAMDHPDMYMSLIIDGRVSNLVNVVIYIYVY